MIGEEGYVVFIRLYDGAEKGEGEQLKGNYVPMAFCAMRCLTSGVFVLYDARV